MTSKTKNPASLAGQNGVSKDVKHVRSNNQKDSTPKPPTKAEACMSAFLKLGTMTTIDANREYGDTALHSIISTLTHKHGVEFTGEYEGFTNRVGKKIYVKRYKPKNIKEMKRVLNNLRIARGVGGFE